jgi:hypothetical protein
MERKLSVKKAAFSFVLLMGIVSLFSDMTHEGAASIIGAYLSLAGASAAVIGFVSGLGEFIGYSLRLVTGWFTDKTKKYWLMTIIGYTVDCMAIPALALVPKNGWIWACLLIVVQRTGKAIKKPAKDTLLSFAESQAGTGKNFAISLFAFGFLDFAIITMHTVKTRLIPEDTLPIIYSGAMAVDAFAALFFGCFF